jgi:hypothetical protein
VQDSLANLQAPTGNVVLRTPDVAQARAYLNGRVVAADGDRLTVRGSAAADLNAALVAQGVRIDELAPERRSLEEVVLQLTTSERVRVAGA